jgi:DNA gyrase subunit B
VTRLGDGLNLDTRRGTKYTFSVTKDPERHIYLPKVTIYVHGIAHEHVFSHEFFESSSYAAIARMGETLDGLIEDGAYIQRGERKQAVLSFEGALDWLMKEAQRGLSLQRYKGLGEMNPDQLWDTTMDPETRRMMKVTIEDAIAADQIFTTLMGDDVEPRRLFIQNNALEVSNLDI